MDGLRYKVQNVTSQGLLDLKSVGENDVKYYGVAPTSVIVLQAEPESSTEDPPATILDAAEAIAPERAVSSAHIELLGEPLVKVMGSFARLYKCHLNGGTEALAAKVLLESTAEHKRSDMLAEIAICRELLPHPRLVRFDLLAERVEIEREIYLAIVMEFVPVTLMQRIQERASAQPSRPFTPLELAAIIANLAAALDHMHTASAIPIMHRDVMPLNVCFPADVLETAQTEPGTPAMAPLDSGLRLIDLGEAAMSTEPLVDFVGTPVITPPEMFASEPHHTPVDIWAVGMIILWCLLLEPMTTGPMGAKTMTEWEASVRASPAALPVFEVQTGGEPPWPAFLEPFAALARRCLAHDPAERPTARQVEASCVEIARPGPRAAVAAC